MFERIVRRTLLAPASRYACTDDNDGVIESQHGRNQRFTDRQTLAAESARCHTRSIPVNEVRRLVLGWVDTPARLELHEAFGVSFNAASPGVLYS